MSTSTIDINDSSSSSSVNHVNICLSFSMCYTDTIIPDLITTFITHIMYIRERIPVQYVELLNARNINSATTVAPSSSSSMICVKQKEKKELRRLNRFVDDMEELLQFIRCIDGNLHTIQQFCLYFGISKTVAKEAYYLTFRRCSEDKCDVDARVSDDRTISQQVAVAKKQMVRELIGMFNSSSNANLNVSVARLNMFINVKLRCRYNDRLNNKHFLTKDSFILKIKRRPRGRRSRNKRETTKKTAAEAGEAAGVLGGTHMMTVEGEEEDCEGGVCNSSSDDTKSNAYSIVIRANDDNNYDSSSSDIQQSGDIYLQLKKGVKAFHLK